MKTLMREYIIYSQSLENLIIDLTSYFIILIVILSLNIYKIIDKKLLIFFSLYSLTPFFFNDFLFNSSSMWDQYTNTFYTLEFRNNFLNQNYLTNYLESYKEQDKKLILLGHIYGIMAFINMNSINSIAFANKLILTLTSIYIIKKKYIDLRYIIFLLLFPSTIIYSSLSLKEILLCVSALWILIFVYEKKYLYLMLLISVFFLIRPQFYTMVIIFMIYFIININLQNRKITFFLFNLILLCFLLLMLQDIFDFLNKYIQIYNQEDAGWGGTLNVENLNFLSFEILSLFKNFTIILNKLILNWPVPFKYKVLFFIENIILLVFIFKNTGEGFKSRKIQTTLSLLFLILNMIILYVIFPNLLPLHRYFFPFLFFFIALFKFNFKHENITRNN